MQAKPIPATLPGTVVAQYRRCGNRGCHCYRGELHGPYWYRFWRDENKRVRSEYVRLADLEAVRAACAARQEEERKTRQTLADGADDIAWFLEGAPYTGDEDDLLRVAAFPHRVQQLTALASGSHVKPEVSFKAFDVLEPLLAHYQAQETAETNRRLLLGDRYTPDSKAGSDSGLNMQELIAKHSGTVALQ